MVSGTTRDLAHTGQMTQAEATTMLSGAFVTGICLKRRRYRSRLGIFSNIGIAASLICMSSSMLIANQVFYALVRGAGYGSDCLICWAGDHGSQQQ